jgi:hypothetical protein
MSDNPAAVSRGWGRHWPRFTIGVGMLFCGGLLVQTTSVFALWLMLLGAVVHAAGWIVIPGKGWRRSLAIAPGVVTMVLILNGASAMAALAIPLAVWLLVRERPLLAYLVLGIPIASAYILAQFLAQYGHGAIVLLVSGSSLVGSAWLASLPWAMRSVSSKPPAILR